LAGCANLKNSLNHASHIRKSLGHE
jgi:hypothetical protein